MSILIEQTEDEIRAEIDFWTKFIAEWQETRNDQAHQRALEALDRAESRLEQMLTQQNRLSETSADSDLLH